jgi:hypothetical protein
MPVVEVDGFPCRVGGENLRRRFKRIAVGNEQRGFFADFERADECSERLSALACYCLSRVACDAKIDGRIPLVIFRAFGWLFLIG